MHASTSHFRACFCISTHGLAEVADNVTVEEMSQAKGVSLRFGIMAVVVLLAALQFQFLGNMESIVGAVCSMSSSMLLPAFFSLRYAMADCIYAVDIVNGHSTSICFSRVQCTRKAQRKFLKSSTKRKS